MLPEEVKVPERATEATEAVTVSVMSGSVTVMEPFVVSVVSVSVRDAVSFPPVMTGESLLPVMVTVTSLVADEGGVLLSVALMV